MTTAGLWKFCAAYPCRTLVRRGYCPAHRQAVEHRRDNWNVRRWYRTVRWRAIRRQVIDDEPLCRRCLVADRVEPTADVDHIVPHGGNESLFWDRGNLQGLCKRCHSLKTQRETCQA